MLQTIEQINSAVNSFVWGVPAMVCIIGVGLLLSFRTRFIQIRKLGYTFRVTLGKMFSSRRLHHAVSGGLYSACRHRWHR